MYKIAADIVGSFISCYICTILIAGRLLNEQGYFKFKNYIILLLAIPFLRILGSLSMAYKIAGVIIIYTIIIKLIYQKGNIASFIVCIFAYSVGLVCDVINSFLYLAVFNIDITYIRSNLYMIYIMHASFFIISFAASLIIRPSKYFNEIEDFVLRKNLFSVFQYVLFFVTSTSLLGYIISVQPYLSIQHIMSAALLILFIAINITYFSQIKISTKAKYDYDNMYDYTNRVEKFAKQLSKQEHEYRNRLMGIQALIENNQYNKALEFVNSIVADQDTNKDSASVNYDKIYNAILKKILIEKTSKALNAGIKINTDVRKEIPTINIQGIVLNDIVSIILDNAIEAATISKDKEIDILIDGEEDEINIIVANSYSKIVEESAIYREGESSNGTFRGNGLYLIKQIEKNNPNITIDTTITEELFIQEVNINNLSEK